MKIMLKNLTLLTILVAVLALFGCGGGGSAPGSATQGGTPTIAGPGAVVAGYTLLTGEAGVSGADILNDTSLSSKTFSWASPGTAGVVATYGTIRFSDKSVHSGKISTSQGILGNFSTSTTWSTSARPVTFTAFSSSGAPSKTWSAAAGSITVTTPTAIYIYEQLAVNTTLGYYVVMKSQQDLSGGVVFVEYQRWYFGTNAAADALAFANSVPAPPAKGVNPYGIAVDASGGIYVPFYSSANVMKFNNTSTASVWNAPTAAGPRAVAVDSSGAVYVVSYIDNTVMKFTTASLLPVWTASTDAGPDGIAVDANGGIYVVNYGSSTVQKFTTDSTSPVWSAPTDTGPTAVAVDATGGIFVANYGSGTIQEFTIDSTSPIWTASTFAGLTSIALDASGGVYVVNYNNLFFNPIDPNNPYGTSTLQKYIPSTTLPDSTKPVWGASITGAGPRAVAVDVNGNVYVANYTDNTVMQFTFPLVPLQVPAWTGTTASPASPSPGPNSIAVDASGGIYVANWNDGTVQKFTTAATTPVWTRNK